ncbi:hypothetical protein U1Q18_022019, partial [Sarracenia purpurea var. burkii]
VSFPIFSSSSVSNVAPCPSHFSTAAPSNSTLAAPLHSHPSTATPIAPSQPPHAAHLQPHSHISNVPLHNTFTSLASLHHNSSHVSNSSAHLHVPATYSDSSLSPSQSFYPPAISLSIPILP